MMEGEGECSLTQSLTNEVIERERTPRTTDFCKRTVGPGYLFKDVNSPFLLSLLVVGSQ